MAQNFMTGRWLHPVLALFALAGLLVLGGCGGGSGAPNNPFAPSPTLPGPLVVLPDVIDIFPGTPTTLTVSGGTPPYSAFSSSPTILPVAQAVAGATIVLSAANVGADTPVTVTVTDSAGKSTTAAVTVRLAPLLNTLTVTPNTTACGANAICSGQTATASVTVTGPGGAGIPNRQVRFDVISGAFSIETNNPGQPLASTLTVVSDANGRAQVVIVAANSAFSQSALLRATDLTTGNQVTAQFTIVQTINGSAALSVVPATATIQGPFVNECSADFRVDYFIYGGTPPYRVTSTFPDAVTILGSPVNTSGGSFEAVTNGTCGNPLPFPILDATGLQTTATLINTPGTATRPTPPPPPVTITPTSYTTASGTGCTGQTFSFIISGGT